jgi:hypothetical protein
VSRLWAAPLIAALLAAAGCGEEDPTGVGAGLLPNDVIQTFEVVLDPARYLVSDTAFGVYSEPAGAGFGFLADRYEGTVDSRILARFTLPSSITLPDSLGVVRTDSMPAFFAGEVVLAIDTTGASTAPPVRLALYRNTEDWHEGSATWTLRVDTPGVQLPWSQAGGSPGLLLDTVSYTATSDSVRLRVDSVTLAIWRNAADPQRGAVIAVETQGARLRTSLPLLHLQVRPPFHRDTIATASVQATERTFIFQPETADSAAVPRVGGTQAWRTFVRLRDRLDTLTVACPGDPNCRLRLSEAQINRAALQLQPVPSPAGFDPEHDVPLTAHFGLPAPTVPLHRLPLTAASLCRTAAGQLEPCDTIPRSSFISADAPVVELPVTDLILTVVREPTDTTAFRPTHIALLPAGIRTFGFGTFAPMPALRLVISIAKELQLP